MRKPKVVIRKPAMKRVWFSVDGQLVDGNRSPSEGGENTMDACKRLNLKPVQSFDPWNENDGALALALDKKDNPVVIGGEPFVQKMTWPGALMFLAEMCHESGNGEEGNYKADFYKLVAALLERGAAR